MLEIKSNLGEVEYSTGGDYYIMNTLADLLCAINRMYLDLALNGRDMDAQFFRDFLKICINDGSAFTVNGKPEGA